MLDYYNNFEIIIILAQIELSEEQSSHSENEEDDNDMEIITSFGTYTVKECEEFIENPELLKFHLDKDLERYTINKDELEKEKLEVQNYVAEAGMYDKVPYTAEH